jgi:hypothetical protein
MNKKMSTEQSKENLPKPMPVPNKTHSAEQALKERLVEACINSTFWMLNRIMVRTWPLFKKCNMNPETEFLFPEMQMKKKEEISSHACRDFEVMHSCYNFMEGDGYKIPGVNVWVQKGRGPTNFIE